ncbi:glycosyltransferase family 25 protein [Mesorhizobium sp. WSM4976]|uniref:glycosyltransferase family 25 protein n=1 Tax=Mesorhizobium sp. WSM4976 TaxID=3038549 RepID=UPI00241711BA|nr:glycosyltransferase family 25 protein [Mesorhizobium sp. WSM4976]MDG4897531.1 glycosyltransferase family 25 protein [Mesorhizobium sp. WSM4976]
MCSAEADGTAARANVLLINLNRSSDRLKFQEAQFRRIGMKFLRQEAVDGALLPHDQYRKNAFLWERPLSRSEVGCLLSHQACWQYVIRSGLNTLILEDDMVLAPEIATFLHDAGKVEGSVAINLEARKNLRHLSTKAVILEGLGGYGIFEMLLGVTGSGAYLLTPDAAAWLVADIGRRGPIADIYIWNAPRVRQLQADPGFAVPMDKMRGLFGHHLPRLGATTITRDMSLARKFGNPKMLIRRAFGQLRLAGEKLRWFGQATGRRVSPLPSIHVSYKAIVDDCLNEHFPR